MRIKAKATLLCGGVVLFLAGTILRAATEEPNKVFRIGIFDHASSEFAQEAQKSPVKFVVNQSDAAKDWPASQLAIFPAGTPVSETSNTSGPREITFSLDQAPAAAYRLRMSFLIESPSVPAIQVGINGKHGTFYLHPKLDYNMGNMLSSFYPAYSSAEVVFSFSGSMLHQGANTISLQPIEQTEKEIPNAALTYDAIELDRDTSRKDSEASSAEIQPTIFYKQQQGQLQEMVDVFIRYAKPANAGDER